MKELIEKLTTAKSLLKNKKYAESIIAFNEIINSNGSRYQEFNQQFDEIAKNDHHLGETFLKMLENLQAANYEPKAEVEDDDIAKLTDSFSKISFAEARIAQQATAFIRLAINEYAAEAALTDFLDPKNTFLLTTALESSEIFVARLNYASKEFINELGTLLTNNREIINELVSVPALIHIKNCFPDFIVPLINKVLADANLFAKAFAPSDVIWPELLTNFLKEFPDYEKQVLAAIANHKAIANVNALIEMKAALPQFIPPLLTNAISTPERFKKVFTSKNEPNLVLLRKFYQAFPDYQGAVVMMVIAFSSQNSSLNKRAYAAPESKEIKSAPFFPIKKESKEPITVNAMCDNLRARVKTIRASDNSQENCVFLAKNIIETINSYLTDTPLPSSVVATGQASLDEATLFHTDGYVYIKDEQSGQLKKQRTVTSTEVVITPAMTTTDYAVTPHINLTEPTSMETEHVDLTAKTIPELSCHVKDLEHKLLLEAQNEKHGGAIFGSIDLIKTNPRENSHRIVFFAATKPTPGVFYVDAQLYNGIEDKGDPIIQHLSEHPIYKFQCNDKSRTTKYIDNCFYMIHGSVNQPLPVKQPEEKITSTATKRATL